MPQKHQGAVQEVLVCKEEGMWGISAPQATLPFTGTRLKTWRQIDRQKLGKRQRDKR